MQSLQVNSPPDITDATAKMLYQRLSVCYVTDDLLPICSRIASIEECKQLAFARMAAASDDAIADLLRLITLQQSVLAQMIGEAGDCRP